jgi:hypothetical protein
VLPDAGALDGIALSDRSILLFLLFAVFAFVCEDLLQLVDLALLLLLFLQ